MALTPEEELELQQLEEEQTSLYGELESLRTQLAKPNQPSISEEEGIPQTSMVEAGLRGAAQGLTFGMADEIGARAESLITGKPYEKALSESRSEYKAAEQEYPITSTLGEVAGGIGQAVGLTALTGGAAAPAAGATAVSRLAKLGQIAKNVLVPTTKAGAVKNIATAARTGAVMGGLTGIGKSEKEGLEALKEAPSAALAGGVAGGVLGGAVEGLGVVGKKAGEVISKGIEEGKYPEFFRMIRTGAKLGGEGKEFLSEASAQRAERQAYKAAGEVIIPELESNLKAARDVRNHLLANSKIPLDIENEVSTLANKLAKRPETEVKDLLSNLKGNISEIVGKPQIKKPSPKLYDAEGNIIKTSPLQVDSPVSQLSALQSYSILKEIDGAVKDELPAEVKRAIFEATKGIRSKIQSSLDPAQVDEILKIPTPDGQDLRSVYQSLTSQLPENSLKNPPIKILDDQMSAVLNASEILGDINPSGKNEAEIIRDIEKVFRNVINQPKETSGAFLSKERYDAAMEKLKDKFPEVERKIQQEVAPIIEELNFRKYIRGEWSGRGIKETGFIKKALGDMGKLTAEGVNIASATKTAIAKGTSGPIPLVPTTTVLRPTVATLNTFKTKLDQKLAATPDNKPVQMFAAMIKNALDQKDESRRAAMLNTLMQYKSFRDMFKEEFPEE
jgi:hypothetical protein